MLLSVTSYGARISLPLTLRSRQYVSAFVQRAVNFYPAFLGFPTLLAKSASTFFRRQDLRLFRGVLLNAAGVSSNECKEMDFRIVWVDLEMSGLDVDAHTIIEMACIVTDSNLNVIAEAPNVVIHHSDDVQQNASDWCKEHFGKSGLWQEVRDSTISLKETEDLMVDFLTKHVIYQKSPLAGNSIYMDRRYLKKYMPKFDDFLHYRIIDVSTIKELSCRWYPDIHSKQPRKQISHRALSDIRESIEELKWYRLNVFAERR